MPLCASVYLYLVVTCWERADFLALACGVKLCLCHIPFGILGQVLYFIVSIPDLCSLTYSEDNVSHSCEKNLNGIIITFRVMVLAERESHKFEVVIDERQYQTKGRG